MNAHASAENYARAAMDRECEEVARTVSGRNEKLNDASYSLGQLVGSGSLDRTIVEGRLFSAALDNGYVAKDGEQQARSTIRSGLEAGIRAPRGEPAATRAFQSSHHSPVSAAAGAGHALPDWTEPQAGKPSFTDVGQLAPSRLADELRRHVYRRGNEPVRTKVKKRDGRYVDFYRVRRPRDGVLGWQAKQPAGYLPTPYIGPAGAIDPFDPDLIDEPLFWPEGEKDVDSLVERGALAFTLGGSSDVPELCAEWLRGRHVIILTDNDAPGQKCGARKVALAFRVAARVRRVDFPELEAGKDVSDWLSERGGSFDALLKRAVTAEPEPQNRARSAAPVREAGTVSAVNVQRVVQVVAGEVPRAVAETERAILAGGLPIYSRAGFLVRPVIETVPASRGRMTTVARFKPLCAASLADHSARVVRFQRYDGRSKDWVTINPPADVMAALLARDGEWELPSLAGVITTPTLRPDGSLLAEPGYDPATRLYLALDPGFRLPAVSERPDRSEAERSLDLLDGLLTAFPFKGDIDRAVALSGIMTAVVRGAMPVAPLHAIRAHTPGTGKSLLVDTASTIATGRRCPVIAAGKTEEETEKRLGALLRDAVPVVSIDNVNGELGGDALCHMTERPMVRVRILGKSEAPEIECRATVFATGNNLTLVGDMTRRAVVCTLDAGVERPELRDFAFSPIERVQLDRGAYVAAVLTIIRAYRAAGSPKVCPPIGSYEEWSDMVRSPLVWLGRSDPVASMETAREEDPELSAVRELFGHWCQHLALSSGFTANAIIKVACEKKFGTYDQAGGFQVPEFRDLLLRQAGEGGNVNTRRLGKWLSKISGRIVGSHWLEMKVDGSHGNRFSLRLAEGSLQA